jgi:hypothetical protein
MSEQPQPQRMQQTMPDDGGGWHHVNAGPHLHMMFHPNRQLLGREPGRLHAAESGNRLPRILYLASGRGLIIAQAGIFSATLSEPSRGRSASPTRLARIFHRRA